MTGGKPDEPPEGGQDWMGLLTAVAAGARLVLETHEGARVVLISEAELERLENGPAVVTGGSTTRERPSLSPREIEVLQLVEDGCTGIQIAERLDLATNTVAQHLASVRRKLGVRSSSTAVAAARELGLLPPPPPEG